MPSGYYRYPSLYHETLVFVSEDDLWTVPTDGGIARRLTSNLGEVSRPSLSPDGTQLAFVGREEGQAEIYVMPSVGGPARRLTFMGGSHCLTAGWRPEGKIIFSTNASQPFPSLLYLYTVDPETLEIERIPVGPARAISFGPQGGTVIGRHTTDPAVWKRYRGGTAGQLWIDEQGEGSFRLLLQLEANLANPMWLPIPGAPLGRVYFISDHEGVGNLYSCLSSGEDLQRHTDHENFYARNPSTDGQRIVYHAGADLYIYNATDGQSRLVPVEFHSPQTQRNRKFVDAAHYLEDWKLHPSGQAVAVTTRGKVFTFANWEGAVIQHGENGDGEPANNRATGVRCRLPRWLKDGKRLIAVTDAGGEESLMIWNVGGNGEPERILDLDIGRPEEIAVNPQKDQIVFSNHRYELLFLDLNTRELRRIDRGQATPIKGFNWSPDGEWVAYSVSISLQVQVLKLWKSANGETYPLTQPVLRDVFPAFDPHGHYLYFISYRTFDPVYDNLHFDLNFPRGMRPYLITLQRDLPSPFVPLPRLDEEEEPDNADEKGADEKKGENKDARQEQDLPGDALEEAVPQIGGVPVVDEQPANGKDEQDEEQFIQIDLEGIQDRIIAFPVTEGLYGRILGVKNGRVLYTRFPVEGTLGSPEGTESTSRSLLLAYNFEEQKEENLLSNLADFDVTPDGAAMIYRAGNSLRVLRAGEKPNNDGFTPNRKSGWLDLDRIKVSVNPGAEWRQMFREAWRLQRDQFWTPDMSQVDWLAVHDRYLPLVDRVSSRSEFSDLMWEMQGELGTSHAYEYGGDYRSEPNYTLGSLGADFKYDPARGGWRITHIIQGDAWEPKTDSPLRRPGVNLTVGDVITAINGRKLTRTFPPRAALVNLADEEVTLTILPEVKQSEESLSSDNLVGQATGELNTQLPEKHQTFELKRTVVVKTIYNESPARYREWVENNRRRVHQATDGRTGYIHIPDMGPRGYAEFHRAYLAEIDRDALIIDVRFNAGGHVSSLILEKLARRRLGYIKSRWSQIPSPYPDDSPMGPMLALTNEYAGSDGDIFSHGFKMMKLGPLLGKRTWGGVIGINPRQTLVDGTITTQPEYSFWFMDVGWGVENYGTNPDLVVEDLPQDYERGIDGQLEKAILEIQAMLANLPAHLPDFPDIPTRAVPRLPKR